MMLFFLGSSQGGDLGGRGVLYEVYVFDLQRNTGQENVSAELNSVFNLDRLFVVSHLIFSSQPSSLLFNLHIVIHISYHQAFIISNPSSDERGFRWYGSGDENERDGLGAERRRNGGQKEQKPK